MEKEHLEDKENSKMENEALEQEQEPTEDKVENLADNDSGDGKKDEELSDIERMEADLAESKEKYLRLYSEFENFRRRTAKERLTLIQTASEDIMSALLPVMDDFERAQDSNEQADADSIREGFNLIHHKFKGILEQKGLKNMEAEKGIEFDSELHDAITQIPTPEKEMEGKVVDVVEKGYYLGEKVIRFAKVVIGAKNE